MLKSHVISIVVYVWLQAIATYALCVLMEMYRWRLYLLLFFLPNKQSWTFMLSRTLPIVKIIWERDGIWIWIGSQTNFRPILWCLMRILCKRDVIPWNIFLPNFYYIHTFSSNVWIPEIKTTPLQILCEVDWSHVCVTVNIILFSW